jgi:tetratricopeptide (TPR) repeat protein
VAQHQRDYSTARATCEEGLEVAQQLGDRVLVGHAFEKLGVIAYFDQDYPVATVHLEKGLALQREIGERRGIAGSLGNLGLVALEQGELAAAQAFFEDSLKLRMEIGDHWGVANVLAFIANLRADLGQPDQAARLWGAAEGLLEQMGASLPPSDRQMYDERMGLARETTGSEAFGAEWASGKEMTEKEAVELGLNGSNEFVVP